MSFLVRFLLGLPPRPSDMAELRRVAPELLTEAPQESVRELKSIDPRLVVALYADCPTFAAKLCAWASVLAEQPKDERPSFDGGECPLEQECPLWTANQHDGNRPKQPSGDTAIQFIAGGAQGNLARRFFDLVRRNAAGLRPESIRRVIITDVYIHDSGGETGKGKGYARLIEYLRAVGAEQNPSIRLEVTPAPKKGGGAKMDRLRERLKKDLGLKDVGCHSTKAAFHDRFYLVEDKKADLRGICGPSLNGLEGARPAVVLLRELDSSETRTLSNYLS